MADWNGDGNMDLVLLAKFFGTSDIDQNSLCTSYLYEQHKIGGKTAFVFKDETFFRNEGCSSFDGSGASLVDVDKDGDLDAICGSYNGPLRVYNRTAAGLVKPNKFPSNSIPLDMIQHLNFLHPVLADWDLDGDLDLALLHPLGHEHPEKNRYFLHLPDDTVTELNGPPNSSCPIDWDKHFSVADFDGDGKDDLVGFGELVGYGFVGVVVCLQTSSGFVVVEPEKIPFNYLSNCPQCLTNLSWIVRWGLEGFPSFQDKTLSTAGVEREAANLGVLAVNKLQKHPKFKDKWAPDALERPNESIGMTECAKTFDDYVKWVANKGYWIDGLQMKALAEKLERDIVVFKWRRGEAIWQRFLVSGKATGKSPDCKLGPLLLALKEGHYRSLLKPTGATPVPTIWLNHTEERHRSCLRGAAKDNENFIHARTAQKGRSPGLSIPPSSPMPSEALKLPSMSSLGFKHCQAAGPTRQQGSGISGRAQLAHCHDSQSMHSVRSEALSLPQSSQKRCLSLTKAANCIPCQAKSQNIWKQAQRLNFFRIRTPEPVLTCNLQPKTRAWRSALWKDRRKQVDPSLRANDSSSNSQTGRRKSPLHLCSLLCNGKNHRSPFGGLALVATKSLSMRSLHATELGGKNIWIKYMEYPLMQCLPRSSGGSWD